MLAACWPDGTQTRPTGWRIAWPAAALPSAGSATTPHTSAGGRLAQGFSWRRALCDLPTHVHRPARRAVAEFDVPPPVSGPQNSNIVCLEHDRPASLTTAG